MSLRFTSFALSLACVMSAAGCGSSSEPGGGADERPGAAASSTGGAIEPCRLLTPEQVSSVLPNHDGGDVAHAGPSLIKGINAYQCSYMNPATDLLTVIVHVAEDAERFKQIQKSRSYHSDHKAVPIADRAWVWGEDNDMNVQVEKGLTILDLELMAGGAATRADALVELARAAAAKVP